MISNVKDYPISSYFNPDDKLRFFIPKYQREYVWKRENWEALFNDLEDSQSGYFLGSIICVNRKLDALQADQLELIDGQQRFATISLLFCAIFQNLSGVVEPDDDLRLELANLKHRLFLKGTKEWRFVPSEQNQNKDDYQKILNELFSTIVPEPKGLRNFGNRRIAHCYGYFRDRLDALEPGKVLEFYEKLRSAVLVKIEVLTYADAFILFEAINNRGIPLSPIDIIKNNLLAELDRRAGYGMDRAFDEWKSLIDSLPEATTQERFLRQLYNAFRYLRPVQVRGCPRAMRSTLITIYDTLLHKQPVRLLKTLQEKSAVYAALLDPVGAQSKWGEEVATALRDLGHLGGAPAYTFLLWLVQVAKDQCWEEETVLAPIVRHLVKWFFWRNLTDMPPTRELDPLFIELINGLVEKLRSHQLDGPDAFIDQATGWLRTRAAPAEIRDVKLGGDIYEENYDATRFMLCKLEESHQTRETKRDLWAYDDNGRPIFTVEHILPKAEKLTRSWIDMLANGDAEKAETIRDRSAHKVGNLTLSGYNSALGRMEFKRKRDRKNEQGDFIGYRNGLYLNRDLAARDSWDEAAIQKRTAQLTEEVKALFSLEGQ